MPAAGRSPNSRRIKSATAERASSTGYRHEAPSVCRVGDPRARSHSRRRRHATCVLRCLSRRDWKSLAAGAVSARVRGLLPPARAMARHTRSIRAALAARFAQPSGVARSETSGCAGVPCGTDTTVPTIRIGSFSSSKGSRSASCAWSCQRPSNTPDCRGRKRRPPQHCREGQQRVPPRSRRWTRPGDAGTASARHTPATIPAATCHMRCLPG